MASLNKVIIIGNLTRDPEVRYTPNGAAVAELSIAVNRTWMDGTEKKEEVTFVDVTLWGKLAEIAGQYLTKGRSAMVEGRLTMDSWDDKTTGQKRSKLKVTGENVQFLGDNKPEGRAESNKRNFSRGNQQQDRQNVREMEQQARRDLDSASPGDVPW